MRKLALFTVSSLALLVTMGLGTQAALADHPDDPNEWCLTGAYKGHNVYDYNSGKAKKFDLSTTPRTQFEKSAIGGSAHMCGTVKGLNGNVGVYVDEVVIATPGKDENILCANPASTVQYCLDQVDPDLVDGGYIGAAEAGAYCPGTGDPEHGNSLCGDEGINAPTVPDIKSYTMYNTGRPNQNDNDPNTCTPDVIACAEARSQPVGGVNCFNDLLTRKLPDSSKFTFTIYPAVCYIGDPDNGISLRNPIRLYDIHFLNLCQYQGAVGGDQCGSDPSRWIFQNGKANPQGKAYKWFATVNMTNETALNQAKAKVKWVP